MGLPVRVSVGRVRGRQIWRARKHRGCGRDHMEREGGERVVGGVGDWKGVFFFFVFFFFWPRGLGLGAWGAGRVVCFFFFFFGGGGGGKGVTVVSSIMNQENERARLCPSESLNFSAADRAGGRARGGRAGRMASPSGYMTEQDTRTRVIRVL